VVLLAAGIGALKLLHKDLAFEVERWADIYLFNRNNRYIHHLLERFSILDDRKLKEISVGTYFYSALLLTEGAGLLLGTSLMSDKRNWLSPSVPKSEGPI
jgi:uncharacterized membrane protein (DUF2068 family)